LKKSTPVTIKLFETCPPGRFSPTGNSETGSCDPCPVGTYASDRGSTSCRACPESLPRTQPGAVSINECRAAPGTFRDKDAGVVRCDSLGEGVTCLSEGLTLETVVIKPGFWRSQNDSKQIFKCINQLFCSGTKTQSGQNGRRRRLEVSGDLCIEHHLGAMCEGCIEGYVRRGLSTCSFCDDDAIAGDRMRLGWTIFAGVLIVVLAFTVVQWNALMKFWRRRRDSVVAMPRRISTMAFSSKARPASTGKAGRARAATDFVRTMSYRVRASTKIDKRVTLLWGFVVSIEANTSLRILLSLFQVTNGVSKTFYDLLPPSFHVITAAFNVVSAELFYQIDMGCIIRSNHNLSLVLAMAAPAAFTFLILVIHFIMERRLKMQRRLADITKLRNGTFSIFLLLLFLIYRTYCFTSSFFALAFEPGN
jgi:hypothetical protein